ncbi:TetR/AcrR family transcriptional regulator [Paracoccus aminophilus]|uniref:Transcriptional regulator, TetR family n=1 Tax=Paracoccus aminophilus JCM 7686 TaxID=1367847 RepID=S5XU25_PARAH|nr:TetR family transcriptional regulator [Paracoccus aminophilus]AGT11009.1 transcriptional regulator, TetR family [Paracoccus aminophilus JCM 7686]
MSDAGEAKTKRLNRQRILEAARDLIEAQGAQSFSMRSLSKALEVSPMALYRHTGDRSTLLGLVLDLILIEHEHRAGIGLSDHDFDKFIHFYGDLVTHNPQVFITFISEPDAKSAEAEKLSQQMLEALLRLGYSADEAVLMRDIVVDHAHGYLLASVAQKDPSALRDLRAGYAVASRLLIDRLMT